MSANFRLSFLDMIVSWEVRKGSWKCFYVSRDGMDIGKKLRIGDTEKWLKSSCRNNLLLNIWLTFYIFLYWVQLNYSTGFKQKCLQGGVWGGGYMWVGKITIPLGIMLTNKDPVLLGIRDVFKIFWLCAEMLNNRYPNHW